MAWKILTPLPSSTREMASGTDREAPSSPHYTSQLCPLRLLPAWPPVNQNSPSHLGGDMEGQCSPHQDAQSQGLSYASLRKLVETSQSGFQTTGAPWGPAVWKLPELPWRNTRATREKRARGPGRSGPGLMSSMDRSGVEARRISAGKGQMLGAQCAQLRGPIRAPLRSRVPFHSRLGNWPSDTTTAAIADPGTWTP